MKMGSAPNDWRIWIGRYERRAWRGQWIHAGLPVLDTKNLPSVATLDERLPNTQTTAFVIGKLYAFVMSSAFPELPRLWDWRTAPRALSCLRRIWPIRGFPLPWPPDDMTDTDAESFATAFVRYSDDLALRVGYL